MHLHCLGTAGYHPSPQRHTSTFFIPEASILLDAGTGVFRLGPHLQSRELDVLITHAHLDHIVGLTYLIGIKAIHPLDKVRVWGDPAKLSAIQNHLFSEDLFPVLPAWMEFVPLPPSGFKLGDAIVRYAHLQHPGGSIGFRLDWPGHSVAYVTDTVANPDEPYVEMLDGVDLLVHECNFTDQEIEFAKYTGHSWGSAVGSVASAAHAGRLLLTHFSPYADQSLPIDLEVVREQFPRAMLAEDELVLMF